MMEIIDCEQGSADWFRARLGLPTASEFQTVLPGSDARTKKRRQTYMDKLAGELITGEPMENYTNAYMERGKLLEDEARAALRLRARRPISPRLASSGTGGLGVPRRLSRAIPA